MIVIIIFIIINITISIKNGAQVNIWPLKPIKSFETPSEPLRHFYYGVHSIGYQSNHTTDGFHSLTYGNKHPWLHFPRIDIAPFLVLMCTADSIFGHNIFVKVELKCFISNSSLVTAWLTLVLLNGSRTDRSFWTNQKAGMKRQFYIFSDFSGFSWLIFDCLFSSTPVETVWTGGFALCGFGQAGESR